jgi:hypothetical protein
MSTTMAKILKNIEKYSRPEREREPEIAAWIATTVSSEAS